MPDYNIYIHTVGNGGNGNANPTTPWSQSEQKSQTNVWDGSDPTGKAAQYVSLIGNPDTIVSRAVSFGMKAFPAVAAAVVSVGMYWYQQHLDFSSLLSGDYREKIKFNDTREIFSNILRPVSTTIQSVRFFTQLRLENDRKQANIELLGDSVINSYTNRGV